MLSSGHPASIITRSPSPGGGYWRCAVLALDRHHAAVLDGEGEPAPLERERLLAEQFAPPAGERRYVGVVVVGDAVEVVDGGDHLGGDAVPFRRHAQQHLEQFHRRLAVDRRSAGVRAAAATSDRARARGGPPRRWPRPISSARSPCGSERKLASRSIVVGACIAMSPMTSSLSTRPRGTSRSCASRSRQAATSISTASSLGLRTRVFRRSQACSGSKR